MKTTEPGRISRPLDRDSARGSSLLQNRFISVRNTSEALAKPLTPEDCNLQSMPDASPIKWHLAHTS